MPCVVHLTTLYETLAPRLVHGFGKSILAKGESGLRKTSGSIL